MWYYLEARVYPLLKNQATRIIYYKQEINATLLTIWLFSQNTWKRYLLSKKLESK